MNILLIHGQNHHGSSYHIGRMVANKLGDNNEIAEFFLPRDLNHFCLGCYQCLEDESRCPFYADKKPIMDKIEEADFLIFTTPTYCMRASAPMKAFIDLTFDYWLPHKPKEVMFHKKAVVISTAAGSGAKHATKDISNTLFYWGIPNVRCYGITTQSMNWAGISAKKKDKIKIDTTKLAKYLMARRIHTSLKQKFMFNMMGVMQKKNMGSHPSEKIYWEKHGWLDKSRPWKK